ncbi:MAG: UPF0182 family protein [Gammaproteobacteria bacterium]
MRNWKLLPALIGVFFFTIVIVYVAFYFIFLDLIVDYWWFTDLHYEGYFWLRLLYRFFLSGGVTLFFFIVFFLHFWIASRYLGLNPPDDVLSDPGKRQRFQRFADLFMSGSIKFYAPLSFILAIIIALPFYQDWESAILYFFGRDSGISDPVYGYDVSFYLFSYPIYELIQKELLFTAAMAFLMVGFLYWVEHNFVPNQRKEFPLGAKIHLTVLVSFLVLFVIWGFLLERFSLLYVNRHEPVFSGPGFVELRYYLPLIWACIAAFLGTSISAIVFIFTFKRGAANVTLIFLMFFAAAFGLRHVKSIPDIIDNLYVKANPVKAEQTFMAYNIEATLAAFDLNNIKTIDYQVSLDPTDDIKLWANQKHFENIPIWDREFLDDVYNQLQGIRPYYQFPTVDEGRYFLLDHIRQVNLAAREINVSKLPPEAQNWENMHLRYTHGYGAVVTAAAADGNNPLTWYLRDLNLYSDVGFHVNKPDIYYGLEDYNYAIVPNKLNVIDISTSQTADIKPFEGKGGISVRSLFRKALLAFYFRDYRIFFSTNITDQSKMLFRRNIVERIKTLTPFIHLDQDPYLVVSSDRFYWIQDAYTLSERYPVSKAVGGEFLDGHKNFNYIRNSVKIIVDAYDGEVHYYIADPADAIIQAYDSAYPGVFKDLRQLPAELRHQLRYPREMYDIQMQIYAKYHQRQPPLFYQQAETWQPAYANNKTVKPYFVTLDFGHCNNWEEFVLLNPMTPINRGNLSMVGVASVADNEACTDAYKPDITVYKFRKDTQVNGPAQVDALINQTPEVAEMFTLWDQHGSQVLRGRMIILPMGNSMLYAQPVYLKATSTTTIPELVRVIVSIGDKVVMDKSLRGAFQRLYDIFLKRNDKSPTDDAVITEPLEPAPSLPDEQ